MLVRTVNYEINETVRNQMVLFPEAIEDYVTEENPVHFLEAFVEKLNMVDG